MDPDLVPDLDIDDKSCKILQLKKNPYFLSKVLRPPLHERRPSYKEAFSHQKNHPELQNTKYLHFFQDPDLADQNECESMRIADPRIQNTVKSIQTFKHIY